MARIAVVGRDKMCRRLASRTRCSRMAGDAIVDKARVIRLGAGHPSRSCMACGAVLATECGMAGWTDNGLGLPGVMAGGTGFARNAGVAVIEMGREEVGRRMAISTIVRGCRMGACAHNGCVGFAEGLGDRTIVAGDASCRQDRGIRMAERGGHPGCVGVTDSTIGRRFDVRQ